MAPYYYGQEASASNIMRFAKSWNSIYQQNTKPGFFFEMSQKVTGNCCIEALGFYSNVGPFALRNLNLNRSLWACKRMYGLLFGCNNSLFCYSKASITFYTWDNACLICITGHAFQLCDHNQDITPQNRFHIYGYLIICALLIYSFNF